MNAWINGYEVVTTEERLARQADRAAADFYRNPSKATWSAMRIANMAYAQEVSR